MSAGRTVRTERRWMGDHRKISETHDAVIGAADIRIVMS